MTGRRHAERANLGIAVTEVREIDRSAWAAALQMVLTDLCQVSLERRHPRMDAA